MQFYRTVASEPYNTKALINSGYRYVDATVISFITTNKESLMQVNLPTFVEYQKLTQRTVSRPEGHDASTDIIHGALGAASEAGEICDAVKRMMFYGKPLDTLNMKEEIGDVMWYLALLCEALGITLQDAAEANIRKLSVRYADKFSDLGAGNRDLEAEKAALAG